MPDRWVNAVVEIVVPLDVPVDASPEDKGEALAAFMERVFEHAGDDWVASGRWEVVEDGEPVLGDD